MAGPKSGTGASGGALSIVVATIIAGIAGYLVTILVVRQLGTAEYATFAIFWAALYLVVGALSGIQQEVTRATHPIGNRIRTTSKARNFALIAGAIVFVAVVASSPVWSTAVFPDFGWELVLPLAVGTASYVLVATLSGSLYGISQWRSLALMIGVDGILRFILVCIGVFATHDLVVIAWLVAVPFPLTLLIVWPIVRGGFVGASDLDVGYRPLTWNVLRTVLASMSTAVLVSGFPLLLGLAAGGASAALVGEFVFVLTLTRAPLIVGVMSLQGFLVVRFRDQPQRWLRFFLAVQSAIAAGAVLLALGGWLLGAPIFSLISGSPITLSGGVIATLVVSSAFVAALCVSGTAVLARGDHFAYSAGWVVAAVATIVVIALPLDFAVRVQASLLVGPVVGLFVHLGWLFLHRSARFITSPPTGESSDGSD